MFKIKKAESIIPATFDEIYLSIKEKNSNLWVNGIEIGVVYETAWKADPDPTKNLSFGSSRYDNKNVFWGLSTLELFRDGCDLALLNTSIEDGQTRILRAEDLTYADFDAQGLDYVPIELELRGFIVQHRLAFGAEILSNEGLTPVMFWSDGIHQTVGGNRFIALSQLVNPQMNFTYLEFRESILWESACTWELKINDALTPYASVAWNDAQGLKALVKLALEEPEILEIAYALDNPDKAEERVRAIKDYEALKVYKLEPEEAIRSRKMLEDYKNGVFKGKYVGWNSLLRDFTVGLGPKYPPHHVGFIFNAIYDDLKDANHMSAANLLELIKGELMAMFAPSGYSVFHCKTFESSTNGSINIAFMKGAEYFRLDIAKYERFRTLREGVFYRDSW